MHRQRVIVEGPQDQRRRQLLDRIHKDNAVKFLEYLASEQAQEYFSAGNDEYPAVPGVGLAPSVAELGIFRPDAIDLSDIAANIGAAQKVLSDAGWK